MNFIDIDITDNYGNSATTLEDKSTIFFKITRTPIDPEQPIMRGGEEMNRLDDIQVEEAEMTKNQMKQFIREMKELLNQDAIEADINI